MSFEFTSREMRAEAEMTGMFPKKESARMAAITGNMARHPLKIAAAMLLMLNSSIKKTIKFNIDPKKAMDSPNIVPAPQRTTQ